MISRNPRKNALARAAVSVADFITGDLAASVLSKVTIGVTGVDLSIGLAPKRPIDERIARLDEARR